MDGAPRSARENPRVYLTLTRGGGRSVGRFRAFCSDAHLSIQEKHAVRHGRLAVVALVVYAVCLLAAGGVIFMLAPAEANKATAIAIPSFCAVLVLLTALVTWFGVRSPGRRGLAKVGVVLGMVLPFLFAAMFLMPLRARMAAAERYPGVLQEWNAAVAAGTVQDTLDAKDSFFREPPSAVAEWDAAVARGDATEDPQARRSFMRKRNAPDHDITYLLAGLGSLLVMSLGFGVGLVVVGLKARREMRDGRDDSAAAGTA